MSDVMLRVRADAPIGTISPRLYGHFAEHLGRCCYDGLFIGADSGTVAHDGGFRADVVEALRAMPVPLLRWPGGCYADHYHWRDGIGPPAERPRRLGMSCGLTVEDDNGLGTHEFLHLCALIGAEPYLAGNVGTGTPEELCDWLEYCNSALDTTLTRMRAANGSPRSFGVRLWGVGNENWGCGGNYDAVTYAKEYRRYATMLRHVDPSAELVICGFEDGWNAALLETATGGRHRIGIALDEWGIWHPEARRNGWGGIPGRRPITYEQAGTLRDALAAAIALEAFHRQCTVLSMANLAQIVNVLHAPVMTEPNGGRMWRTPTYHVFRFHAPHIGATALPVEIAGGATDPDGISAVSATASASDRGMAVTIINRHLTESASIGLRGIAGAEPQAHVLTAASPREQNSADEPERVAPVPLAVAGNARDGWHLDLPPHALATVRFAGAA